MTIDDDALARQDDRIDWLAEILEHELAERLAYSTTGTWPTIWNAYGQFRRLLQGGDAP